jgi:hypothetical protein
MSHLPTRSVLRSLPRQSLASLLAAAVLALGVTGCTSVGVTAVAAPSEPGTSGLDVRVFDRAKDARAGHVSSGRVLSVLETTKGAAVHSAEGSEWSVAGLAPGDYRLRIRQWKKGNSDSQRPDAEATKRLTLKPGEHAAMEVIARKVTTGIVLGITAAVVVVAVVIVAITVKPLGSGPLLKGEERRATEPLPAGVAAGPVPAARGHGDRLVVLESTPVRSSWGLK